jgi:hypothetical protein
LNTESFIKALFGDNQGYLFLSTKSSPEAGIDTHVAFNYPTELSRIVGYARAREEEDLYFAPFLYVVPRRRPESISCAPMVYADTDLFNPEDYLLAPTLNVQTSEDKTHSFWVLDADYGKDEVSEMARIVALTHAKKINGIQAGVDTSGWDLAQLLRVPNSWNTKHEPPFEVTVWNYSGEVYSMADFEAVYTTEGIPDRVLPTDAPMPEKLPEAADVLRKLTLDKNLIAAYGATPRGTEDWSDKLYHFVSMCFRAGFEPEEVLVAAWGAASNKYARDDRPMSDLWRYDVVKAASDPENKPRRKIEIEAAPVTPKDTNFSAKRLEQVFLTEDERKLLTKTFVDSYVEWASAKTNAPESYHIASALTILSCVLGEWGQAFPLFGEFNLGLFFVVMGETTKTRKSTARNLMKKVLRMLQGTEYGYIVSSDATQEALLDVLSERTQRTSMYDRDEAQQLISDVKGGKSYMAGFLDFLNELYDGNARGKARANKRTEDTPVVFVQYLMGIRSQIQDNLELKDFLSGWGPRNIFVRGEAPPRTREENRLKQGKPQIGGSIDPGFISIVTTMETIRNYWETKVQSRDRKQIILFEEDAWERLIDFGEHLEDYVKGHPREEVLSACVDRLLLNVLKVATLFAMFERRDKGNMQDVLNAIYYGMQWIEDLVIVVEGVTESTLQRDLDQFEKFILDNDGFVTYAKALKWATAQGKNRKEFADMIETMKETEVIEIVTDSGDRTSIKLTYV